MGLYQRGKEGDSKEVNGRASGSPFVRTLKCAVSTGMSYGLESGDTRVLFPELFVCCWAMARRGGDRVGESDPPFPR